MVTCPNCIRPGQSHPGYLNGSRCGVCRGWGVATLLRVMAWECSLTSTRKDN